MGMENGLKGLEKAESDILDSHVDSSDFELIYNYLKEKRPESRAFDGVNTFNRNEEKFECSYKTADRLEKSLAKSLCMETFYGGTPELGVFSIWFDDPEKLQEISTDNYARVRLRKYHQPGDLSCGDKFIWAEFRSVEKLSVKKNRFGMHVENLGDFLRNADIAPAIRALYNNPEECGKAIGTYSGISAWLREKNARPFVAVDYCRKAFNSADMTARVTIDRRIKYYRVPPEISAADFERENFECIGAEDVAMVKFKYSTPLPAEIRKLEAGLFAPRSKIKRALDFLRVWNALKNGEKRCL